MNNAIETMKNIIDELNECTGPDALENFSKKDLLEKIAESNNLAVINWFKEQNLDKQTLYSMDENTLGKKMSELLDRVRNANDHSTDLERDYEEDEREME